jgi:hypothetical protein
MFWDASSYIHNSLHLDDTAPLESSVHLHRMDPMYCNIIPVVSS